MTISIMQKVREKIETLPEGSVITYRSFPSSYSLNAVAPALSRLRKQGFIERLEKGKYFKPRSTRFGKLPPSEREVLNLFSRDKNYIVGMAAYNRLGLTTQVPNEIVILGNKYNRKRKLSGLNIRYQKSFSSIRAESENLYQIVDALKNLKRIPDANVNQSLRILIQSIASLNKNEQIKLIQIGFKSKPVVRALLGAIFEKQFPEFSEKLRKSLNPLTTYKLGTDTDTLPNNKEWKIL